MLTAVILILCISVFLCTRSKTPEEHLVETLLNQLTGQDIYLKIWTSEKEMELRQKGWVDIRYNIISKDGIRIDKDMGIG